MTGNTQKNAKRFVIINIVIYFLMGFLAFPLSGYMGIENIFTNFGLVPAKFWNGALWQPLTSMFLHGSLLHLFMNMIALWSIGSMLELDLGSKKFVHLYIFSGLFGALFVVLFQYGSIIPTVGASGAITGLLGALAILHPDTSLLFFIFPVRARTAAVFLGIISFIFAAFDPTSQISHLGHLGGLIGGLIYTKYILSEYSTVGPEFSTFSRGPHINKWNIPERWGTHFQSPGQGRTIVYDIYTGKFYYRD